MMIKLTNEVGIRKINMATLLAQLEDENIEETKSKLRVVAEFINQTGRFKNKTQSQSLKPYQHTSTERKLQREQGTVEKTTAPTRQVVP